MMQFLNVRSYLEDYLRDRYAYDTWSGNVEQILITGKQEAVQVFFAGRKMGDIAEGDLLVPYTPFQVGTSVTVELRKEGYHRGNL